MQLKIGDQYYNGHGERVTIDNRYEGTGYYDYYGATFYVGGTDGKFYWGEGPLIGREADGRSKDSKAEQRDLVIVPAYTQTQLDLFD